MKPVQDMTSDQLNKLAFSAKKELERRKKVEKASNEIRAILKKYSLSLNEINLKNSTQAKKLGAQKTAAPPSKKVSQIASKGGKSKARAQVRNSKPKKDKRSVVKPKYVNTNGTEFWTGRGKAPIWVQAICDEKNITLAEFKGNAEFQL